jgi:predicted alpha/beta superfamily hydrolase
MKETDIAAVPAADPEVTLLMPREMTGGELVLLVGEGGEAERAAAMMTKDAAMMCVRCADWDGCLSPWPAPKAFRSGNDFSGGAGEYLRSILGALPAAEAALGFAPSRRWIAGYSLAGLFAVYALYECGAFDGAACVSGSLWFDGFTDYMAAHRPVKTPERVYFSLGQTEAATRNSRLAAVERETARAEEIMRLSGADTVFERNPGGHFADDAPRLAKGIDWLLGR